MPAAKWAAREAVILNISTIYLRISLSLVLLLRCSTAEFIEYPMDITLPLGSLAEFRCQHQTADNIGWRINNETFSEGQFPDITDDRIAGNGPDIYTLTVPANVERNMTEVVCVAVFFDGITLPAFTPPAILIVLPEDTVSTPPPTIATTVTPTTEKPTIPIFSDDFIEVPSPLVVAVTLNEMYVYRCNHSETESIFWIINNTRLNEISPGPPLISPNIIPLSDGRRVSTLTIGGIVKNNRTMVQCLAISQDGVSTAVTANTTFLIQGPLQAVKYLNRSLDTSAIRWAAPFSLNLTNVKPDIAYCVEVYNITCGRSLVISDCDVFETSYSSDDLRPGYIYEYTVTPRSNVEGAQNGTSLSVSEKFKQLSLIDHSFEINLTDDISASADLKFVGLDVQHQVFTSSYFLSLSPIDGVELGENESSLLVPATTRGKEGIVTLTTFLPFRRRFNYTVLAHGCEEHPVTDKMEISTHDVQHISIVSPRPNILTITGGFIRSSTSIGVLAVMVPIDTQLDPIYRFVDRESTTSLGIEDIRLLGSDYSISVFVVEESGLPFTRTASTPITVTVSGGVEETSPTIDYELLVNSSGVCISCTFLERSTATDCVAVVHQRISQLNSSAGLMNIESSHKFTRSGDTASGCIEGVNLEVYQVGVISVNTEVEITDPPTEEGTGGEVVPQRCDSSCVAVASVVAVSLCLCVVLLVAILALLYRRKLKSKKLLHATMRSNSPESNVYTRVDIGQEVLKDQCEAQSTSAGAKDSGYADIMDFKSDSLKPLPQRDNVVYDDIQGFRNPSGQHYALLGLQGEPGEKPRDLSAVVYCEVKAQAAPVEPEQDSCEDKKDLSSPTTATTPFDLEHLLSELMGVASKWKELGEALLLDDDLLDEIYTNNETDEECLRDMLERYLMRVDGNHSWEAVHEALKKIGAKGALHNEESPSRPPLKDKESSREELDSLVKDSQSDNNYCVSEGGLPVPQPSTHSSQLEQDLASYPGSREPGYEAQQNQDQPMHRDTESCVPES